MMQGNQKSDYVSPTIYSGYTLSNSGEEVQENQHSRISFSYWNSCLKITIQPRLESSYGKDIAEFDTKSTACIYIRCFKASILANEINKFIHDPNYKKNTACGMGSGGSVMIVSRDKNNTYNITIINKNTGSQATYICHKKFFEYITEFNFKDQSFKESSDGYELKDLEILVDQLNAFYQAMSNSIAYTVVDRTHYNEVRLNDNIEAIAAKLGVEVRSAGGYKKRTSYKDMNSSTSFSHDTMDNFNSTLDDMT